MVDKAQDALNMTVLRLVEIVTDLERRVGKLERGEHPTT